ncbi:MAG TPA: hypothetical protein VIU64_21030, partial [Polyangia bacterium]
MMAGPVVRFRLSPIVRWSLLTALAGMPAAARGAAAESATTPSAMVVVRDPVACPDAAALGAALKGLLPPRQGGEGPS